MCKEDDLNAAWAEIDKTTKAMAARIQKMIDEINRLVTKSLSGPQTEIILASLGSLSTLFEIVSDTMAGYPCVLMGGPKDGLRIDLKDLVDELRLPRESEEMPPPLQMKKNMAHHGHPFSFDCRMYLYKINPKQDKSGVFRYNYVQPIQTSNFKK